MLPQDDTLHDDAIAILAEVELHKLTATPGTITPFAASRIEWEVSGPPGFSVLLESKNVARVGEQTVTPLSTRAFRLRARAGVLTQVLGTVTVTVDNSACKIIPVPNHFLLTQVQEGIDQLLAELPGTTRRRADVVTVDQTGLGMKLALKQKVPKFPNPDVDVEAHWRYRAADGGLFADFDKLAVSVSFPWWVWLLPIAYPGLPIAIDMAKESTSAKVRKKAADGAEALELFVGEGLRILSAQSNPANFEMLACPDGALSLLVLPGIPSVGLAKS